MTSSVTDIFDLEGKTAVVTGTSAGIGTRLARTLVLAGARVVAIDAGEPSSTTRRRGRDG